jgi:hypothetical protein
MHAVEGTYHPEGRHVQRPCGGSTADLFEGHQGDQCEISERKNSGR